MLNFPFPPLCNQILAPYYLFPKLKGLIFIFPVRDHIYVSKMPCVPTSYPSILYIYISLRCGVCIDIKKNVNCRLKSYLNVEWAEGLERAHFATFMKEYQRFLFSSALIDCISFSYIVNSSYLCLLSM